MSIAPRRGMGPALEGGRSYAQGAPGMTQRRYDLDWLRIAAFAIRILYHCGMFYVTWGWQVK